MSTVGSNPAPGWYANPVNGAEERWWDGVQWTPTVRPATPAQPQYPQPTYQPQSTVPQQGGYPQQTYSPQAYAAPAYGAVPAPSYSGAPAPSYGIPANTPPAYSAAPAPAFDFSAPRALEATPATGSYGAPSGYSDQSYAAQPAGNQGFGATATSTVGGADDYSWASSVTVKKDNWFDGNGAAAGKGEKNGAAVAGFVLSLFGFGLISLIVSSSGRAKATRLAKEGGRPVGRALARWGTALSLIQVLAFLGSALLGYQFYSSGWGYDRASFESSFAQGYETTSGEELQQITCPTSASLAPYSTIDCHITTAAGQNLVVHIAVNGFGEDPTVTSDPE